MELLENEKMIEDLPKLKSFLKLVSSEPIRYEHAWWKP